jgi:RNA 3'-terminal phosphate cyclase (ATP)
MCVVLRNASAYACILRKPVHITDIRGKRHVPGLRQQHLSGLQLLTKISGGVLEGGRVESREILLRPAKLGITETDFTSDQQGAGYVFVEVWG